MNLIPVPKSGDLSQAGNYRGICLNSIVAKTYNRMLLNRIRPHLDELLRTNQNGFREGRGTTSHILGLRRIIEGIHSNNLSAVITFIDFKKAFDTIHRGKMIQILKAYGIPQVITDAIDETYRNTRAKVISPDGDTELFDILAGVLQGDTLAPYLFIIILDYCLRIAISGREEELGFTIKPRQSRRIGPKKVTDLDFADDIALLSDTKEQAQKLLIYVEEAALKTGLHMNAKKTKCMVFHQTQAVQLKTSNGNNLDNVEDFKYLGAWVGSSQHDIKIRKALAWKACNALNKVWKSSLCRKIKIRLFQATVQSVLLYGAETWTITNRLKKSLDGCYTRMLRTALNISWKDKVTNKDLYGNLQKVSENITDRRTRFAGHCIRRENEIVSDLVLWRPKHGHTSVGRPALTYLDTLVKDTGLTGEEMKACMRDRVIWRAITKTDRDRPK